MSIPVVINEQLFSSSTGPFSIIGTYDQETDVGCRFGSNGPSCTVAAGAAAGTSPTITISGNDFNSYVTLTTGTGPTTGVLFTITFSGAFARPVRHANIIGRNAVSSVALPLIYLGSTTSTTAVFSVSTALAATTQYIWSVQCTA